MSGAIVAQHFLLSAAARTLSLSAVARMSDDEARATFQRIRWADNAGEPCCPQRGCLKAYKVASPPVCCVSYIMPRAPLRMLKPVPAFPGALDRLSTRAGS